MKRFLSIVLSVIILLPSFLFVNAATQEPHDYFQYGYDQEYVFGIPYGTLCSEIKESLQKKWSYSVSIKKANGTAANNTDKACTGMVVNYKGKLVPIVVYGDCNGDGLVNVSDKIAQQNIIMNSTSSAVVDALSKAADMDFNGRAVVSDINLLSNYVMNGLGSAKFIESADFGNSHFRMNDISQDIDSVHYTNSKVTSDSTDYFLSSLQNSTLFAFGGHGNYNHITMSQGDSNKTININTINSLANGAFSQCRLALFSSCLTAQGGENADNFAHAVKNKGVKTVIGFSNTIYSTEAWLWNDWFYHYCSLGHTIEEACFEANYIIKNDVTGLNYADNHINGLVIFGDKTQRIAQPLAAQELIESYSLDNAQNPMLAFDSNLHQEFDEENYKGYYDLSALRNSDSNIQTLSETNSRTDLAEEALSEYIDTDDYTFVGEGYNESLNIYTLNYSKLINGIESIDKGFVMIKNNNVVAVGVSNTGAFDSITVPAVTETMITDYLTSETESKMYELDKYSYSIDSTGNPIIDIGIIVNDGEYSYGESVKMPLL